jgi:hypothetical protein
VALTEFHLFLKLPKEIQSIVWKYACTFPRIVEFLIGRKRDPEGPSKTPVPALLHACQFARIEGLKIHNEVPRHRPRNRKTYINWEVDSLFLSQEGTRDADRQRYLKGDKPMKIVRQNCHHLVIPMLTLCGTPENQYGVFGHSFEKLKTCTIDLMRSRDEQSQILNNILRNPYIQAADGVCDPMDPPDLVFKPFFGHFKTQNPQLEVFAGAVDGKSDFYLKKSK